MARFSDADAILTAAAQWKEDCLLADGSIFSERELWTLPNVQELVRHYVENLDYGEGGFFAKLEAQLEPASPEATQLAAEMFWVLYLIVSKGFISAETKRFQIRKVWGWSGASLPEEHWALGDLLAKGVANPGTAYNTHRWRELRYFITAMKDWKSLGRDAREDLLSEPWEFARWLENREYAAGRQFRHVLLFLLFPDEFERISTASHKRKIVRSFREEWGENPEDFEYDDRVALDREVLRIRERLEEDYEDREIDFYREPARDTWREEPDTEKNGDEPDLPPEEESRKWYKDRFGESRVWALSAGAGGRMWSDFIGEDIIAIGWDFLGDLAEYPSRDAIHDAVAEHTGKTNPYNDSLACWQFAHEVSEGDVILAKKGRSKLLGLGRVTGDYLYDPERGEYQNVRAVEWERTGTWDIPRDRWITNKTLTDFTDYLSWVRWAVEVMEGTGTREFDPRGSEYTMEHALEGLFVSREQFSSILDTLSRRKNVILQGPPGVGKTFISRRIAWRLMGRRDPERLEFVQFHQSYAYEDFIQGYRPTEDGSFELRDGVFHRFATRASDRPGQPHVLIIDEINRGNLSRIFGELMVLIEDDKRGEEHAVPLTYSEAGDSFHVPDNLYLLGLMNTADRSLALVDYALRRRFGFVDLEPAFGTEAFSEYLLRNEVEPSVVELIVDRMSDLNEAIREDRRNLGPGFEIGHSYFVPSGDEESLDQTWYRAIVEAQIEPLLREYWFDHPDTVQEKLGELLP